MDTIIQLHKVGYKYPAMLCGYLDSWLFCTVKNLFNQSTEREMNRKTQQKKKSSRIVNNSLDALVCSIAEYFHSLFVFWLAQQARQNTVQLEKILSDSTHQNVL